MGSTSDNKEKFSSRMAAAEADLTRVLFVDGPEIEIGGLNTESIVKFDNDMGDLLIQAKEFGAQVIIVETLVEHMGDREGKNSRRSTNNASDVRQAIAPFRALCKEADMYGIGVVHPNKSVDVGMNNSISGSAAFQQIARAVHHVYRDPTDDGEFPTRLLFTSKDNYRKRHPPTLAFDIVSWDIARGEKCSCPDDEDAECQARGHEGRIVWGGEDDRTAEDIWQELIQQRKEQAPRSDTAVQEAEKMFKELADEHGLVNMKTGDIEKYGAEMGISKSSIRRARDKEEVDPILRTGVRHS